MNNSKQRVYDIVCACGDSWIISEHIAQNAGFYQNHTCKILSFLINDGLVESRYVIKDGKKQNYKEYRAIPQSDSKGDLSQDKTKGDIKRTHQK